MKRNSAHTYLRIAVILALAAPLLRSAPAEARSQRSLPYRSDLAWSTAVRLLRVDMGFDLVERDQDAQFVLFRYTQGENSFPGSLEIVERRLEDGRVGARVVVSVPAMPSYVELHLIDRLERKLTEEVGPPLPVPEPEPEPPAAPEPDEDEDDDDAE